MSTLAESRKVTSNTKYYSQVTEADERKNIQAQYHDVYEYRNSLRDQGGA
jgi:hypothetical protein